eukprot:1157780-Pelagomonas_calceolata.AAC.22
MTQMRCLPVLCEGGCGLAVTMTCSGVLAGAPSAGALCAADEQLTTLLRPWVVEACTVAPCLLLLLLLLLLLWRRGLQSS